MDHPIKNSQIIWRDDIKIGYKLDTASFIQKEIESNLISTSSVIEPFSII